MTSEIETPATVKQKVPVKSGRSRTARLGLWALVMVALALVVGGGIYAWRTWFGANDPANSVLTAVVSRGDIEDTVTATGTLQPKDYVDVGTQVSGQLKRLLVEIGAIVESGQLLAEIDPSVYQAKVDADRAQLLNQRAQLTDRQAQLALAEQQFVRQQNMARDNATSTEAVQSAEATQQSARAGQCV